MLEMMGYMSRPILEHNRHIRMAAKREAVRSLSLPDLTAETPIPESVAKDSAKVKTAGGIR